MIKFDAISKNETKSLDTKGLRENFLCKEIFKKDEVVYNYSLYDRVIIGGVMPVSKIIELNLSKELGVDFFLQRREIGLINIGGPAIISVDGENFELNSRDGIYIGVGKKKITCKSSNSNNPAKLYFMSTTGQLEFPTTKIEIEKAQPIHLGEDKTSNKRTIFQYFHPNTCKTNQLLMGVTLLEPNNMWNTMPAHTHERRMEAYLYFNMSEEDRVFHMMGEPTETRHIIVANEQAILSPSWSIHGGVGTGTYSFIWAMAGENQTFTDMQKVEIKDLK